MTLAYLVGFSAVYLVAVVVILGFASRWRLRMEEARNAARTASVRRLVRLNEASAEVHDALAYQKRTNEASKGRVRRAEEAAEANARAAEANSDMLAESRAANARLAAKYAAGTDMLAQHARNINSAATAARTHSLSRATENARLLRELERDIEALYKGAATPQQVEAEVAKLEAEMAEHRRTTQAASDGFYSTVAALLAASDAAQRETGEEIATMFATKVEAQAQASELLAGVGAAKQELEAQYASALARADEVEAACGLRNARDLDAAALDGIQTAYDDILAKLSDYTAIVDDNETRWQQLDGQLADVEGSVTAALSGAETLNAEVSAALADLDEYIKAECTPLEWAENLDDNIEAASKRADELATNVDTARVACEGAAIKCVSAEDACVKAQGSTALNLAEGGSVEVAGAGTLSLAGGTLSFCDLDAVCTDLN